MDISFAPQNNKISLFLYTGRSSDLESIFSLILSGNCVALYGERRSGKTLTLEMMEHIINNNISHDGHITISSLSIIDKKLTQEVPGWTIRLQSYSAILVSLGGIRYERELCNQFAVALRKINIHCTSTLSDNEVGIMGLRALLSEVQQNLQTSRKKMVILIDEMENLGDFDQGVAIAEEFCNRRDYTELVFVHTGSYLWRERVISPGSLFTHLEPYYLKSIDRGDAITFLLKPLGNDFLKKVAIELSGSKPLYLQFIAKHIHESGKIPLERELFSHSSLCGQIKQNIYEEKNLDEGSGKILVALCHHPLKGEQWLARCLAMSIEEVRNSLSKLLDFGTIVKDGNGYLITGKFIELYGRKMYSDPTRRNYNKPPTKIDSSLRQILRWLMVPILISFAVCLYRYSNPATVFRELSTANQVVIEYEFPKSVEIDEEGVIGISATNKGTSSIELLTVIFKSDSIQYINDNTNVVSFVDLMPDVTYYSTIQYRVYRDDKAVLSSRVTSMGEDSFFDSYLRKLPIKRFSTLLSALLAFVGFILPGRKGWVILLSSLLKGPSNQSDS